MSSPGTPERISRLRRFLEVLKRINEIAPHSETESAIRYRESQLESLEISQVNHG